MAKSKAKQKPAIPILSKYQVNDTFEDYLGAKEFLSSSDLKAILKSPKHYLWQKEKPSNEEKDSLIIGSAVHCGILEPVQFHNRFFHLKKEMLPLPDNDFRTKLNSEYRDMILEKMRSENKQILDDKQFERIDMMVKSVSNNKTAMKILENTLAEQSFYLDLKVDDEFRPRVRVRPDAISLSGEYYVSIKTTTDASPAGFARQAHSWGYHISEAFYFRTLFKALAPDRKLKRGYMIVVENTKPFTCQVYDLNENAEFGEVSEFLEIGNHYLMMGLQRLKECIASNSFPGYEIESDRPDGIMQLRLPNYALYKANNTII